MLVHQMTLKEEIFFFFFFYITDSQLSPEQAVHRVKECHLPEEQTAEHTIT